MGLVLSTRLLASFCLYCVETQLSLQPGVGHPTLKAPDLDTKQKGLPYSAWPHFRQISTQPQANSNSDPDECCRLLLAEHSALHAGSNAQALPPDSSAAFPPQLRSWPKEKKQPNLQVRTDIHPSSLLIQIQSPEETPVSRLGKWQPILHS